MHNAAHPQHPMLQHHFDTLEQQQESSALGMWIFLVTEVLFFGGMFFAYVIYRMWYPDAWLAASHHLDIPLGAANTVVLGEREHLLCREAFLRECTWHLGQLPAAGLRCRLRSRHRGALVPVTIFAHHDGAAARVVFDEPQVRASHGQAGVAYSDDGTVCLGGGWFSPDPALDAASSVAASAASHQAIVDPIESPIVPRRFSSIPGCEASTSRARMLS